jgi:hypothetical protein
VIELGLGWRRRLVLPLSDRPQDAERDQAPERHAQQGAYSKPSRQTEVVAVKPVVLALLGCFGRLDATVRDFE